MLRLLALVTRRCGRLLSCTGQSIVVKKVSVLTARFLMSVLSMRRVLAALAFLAAISIIYYGALVGNQSNSNTASYAAARAQIVFGSEAAPRHFAVVGEARVRLRPALAVVANKTVERRVLLAQSAWRATSASTLDVASAQAAMHYTKFPYQTMRGGALAEMLPLEDDIRALYAIIVFEDFEAYAELPHNVRVLLENYCRKYEVAIVVLPGAMGSADAAAHEEFQPFDDSLPLEYSKGVGVSSYSLHPVPVLLPSLSPQQPPPLPLYRFTRADALSSDVPAVPIDGWAVFHPLHETYVTVATACAPLGGDLEDLALNSSTEDDCTKALGNKRSPVVLLDVGAFDGVRRAFFGYRLGFWVHRLLFLDLLSYFTRGVLELPLERFVQIDIDDVFVGEEGTKLHVEDAEYLRSTQARWRAEHGIANFTFYLGYSGQFYRSGNSAEQQGDDRLLELRDNFAWFCHTWAHAQPHTYVNETQFLDQLTVNWRFAKEKGITVDTTYSVAPHHSGVYPTHDLLYAAWRGILGVQVTSTEEYPHLYPARLRRGFVHRDIKVLPRQVCGLFTKTLSYSGYPGGPQRLEAMISGGDLFDTFLYNPINIFMTHQQNYGNGDRLAVYTFDKMFKFLRRYTTFTLHWAPAVQLASLYFELFPDEKSPVWTNPCHDKRHLDIWNARKSCTLPEFLIVGPQKTGTTALSLFLQLHPDVSASIPSPVTFEEVRFFGNVYYNNGIDWYMSFFPNIKPHQKTSPVDESMHVTPGTVYFDKSANYFDSPQAPQQAHALLPAAKIIVILLNPVDRAFSWYHHQRAHDDPAAHFHDFYDVVTAKPNASKELLMLQARTIVPGLYASHIESWRKYYLDKQIMIVDGEELKVNPANVMYNVQKFLQLKYIYDYNKALVFDPKKQFFCVSVGKGPQCLGLGKGRSRDYGSVDLRSEAALRAIYLEPNRSLKKLLSTMGYALPDWLHSVT